MAESISDITNNLNSEMLGFKTFYDEKYNQNQEKEDEQKKRDELMKEAGRLEAQSLTLINMLDDIASRSPYDEIFSSVVPNVTALSSGGASGILAPSRSIIDDINDDYRKSIERKNTKSSENSKVGSSVMSPSRDKEKVVYLGDVLPPSYHKQTRSSKDGPGPAVIKSSIERVYQDNNTNVGLMQRVADIEYQAAYDAMMKIQAIRHGLGHRVEELDHIHSEVVGGKSFNKIEKTSTNDPKNHQLPYKSELSLMTDEVHHVHDSIGKTSRIIGSTLDEVIASLKRNLSQAPAPTPVPNPLTGVAPLPVSHNTVPHHNPVVTSAMTTPVHSTIGQAVTSNTVPHGPPLVKSASLDRLQYSSSNNPLKKTTSTEKIFDLESAVKASENIIRLPREMYHSPVPRMQYESNPSIPVNRPAFNTSKPVAPTIVRPSSLQHTSNESYSVINPATAATIQPTSSLYDRQQYLKKLQRERQYFDGYQTSQI